ncbi:SprT-like domain-containing protein [Trueperella bialowiezensis]|uniref:SprT-like domain-containing protein n=1 Tax=Trueperella bialowiezensis TaxID=312285 RepID=UPI000F848DE3|nr:SprT-like domain-containing protein [Trueperella bialowiezensis]
MNLSDAAVLVRDLMDAQGLTDWALVFDRAKRRAGRTRFAAREISLSREFIELFTAEQVRKLALHEIAHALVGPSHGHDSTWRSTCLSIGGDGRTKLDPAMPVPRGVWHGVCPSGHEVWRHRRPSHPSSCAVCNPDFAEANRFTWHNIRTGEVLV